MKTHCIGKAILVLTRFNKIAIQNYKFQVASGQRSHLLVEVPTISINFAMLHKQFCTIDHNVMHLFLRSSPVT